MKILKAKVQWMFGYANKPSFQLLVDEFPEHEDLRYQYKEGFYYTEKDGYVNFFYEDKRDRSGFAGRVFKITMEDGEKREIVGPWSSRAGAINNHFPHVVDVSFTDAEEAFNRGYTYYAGAITLTLARYAAKLANVELIGVLDSGDIRWDIQGKEELNAKAKRMKEKGINLPDPFQDGKLYEQMVLTYVE